MPYAMDLRFRGDDGIQNKALSAYLVIPTQAGILCLMLRISALAEMTVFKTRP